MTKAEQEKMDALEKENKELKDANAKQSELIEVLEEDLEKSQGSKAKVGKSVVAKEDLPPAKKGYTTAKDYRKAKEAKEKEAQERLKKSKG